MFNWFTLALSATIFLSIFSLLTKKIFNQGHDPVIYGGMMQLLVGIIGIIVILFTGFTFVATGQNILLLGLVGITYTLAATLFYLGLSQVELSRSTVLGSPAIFWGVLTGLILLKEPLTSTKIFAVFFIFIALLLVNIKKKTSLSFGKYEFFILLSTIFYAIGAALDKYLVAASSPVSYIALSFLTAGSTMLLVHNRRLRLSWKKLVNNSEFVITLIVNSLFIYVSYFLLFTAYNTGGEVSKVYAIEQSYTILATFLGIFFLKESDNLVKKILAASLTFIGLLLLRT